MSLPQAIFNDPVESWPLCDVLLSWHSEGFPLRKAQEYVELRQPFLINDGVFTASDQARDGSCCAVTCCAVLCFLLSRLDPVVSCVVLCNF